MLRPKLFGIVALACAVLSLHAYAADETPATTPEPATPEAQQLKDVQTDAALAKAELELAQSELELLKLKVGSIDTTNLPKGTATVTDMNLEGSLRAYAAAKNSIDEIAKAVAKELKADASNKKPVVLATDVQLQSLNQYRSFLAQIEELRKKSEEVLTAKPPTIEDPCPPPSPLMSVTGVSTAGVVINSMLSFAALFKKDVELKGKDVTLNDFAMTTMMLQSLKTNNISPIYPSAYYLLPPGDVDGKPLDEWNKLFAYKKKLSDKADEYTAEYEALPEPTNPNAACKKKIAALKARVDSYLAGLAAAGKSIDEIGAALTKQDAQSGLTLLSTYLVSERVEKVIGKAPVLQVKAIAAGGSTQVVKGAFSTKVAFGGGSIISYQLFNQDGSLQLADTIPWYAGFIEAKDFKPGLVKLQ